MNRLKTRWRTNGAKRRTYGAGKGWCAIAPFMAPKGDHNGAQQWRTHPSLSGMAHGALRFDQDLAKRNRTQDNGAQDYYSVRVL